MSKAGKPATAGRKPGSEFTINVPSTGGTEPAYTEEDVSPYDFATIYNVLPLWKKGIDGTGQTIAIAGTSDISQNDISTFRTFFGLPTNLPANTPQIVHPNPSRPGGDDPGICTTTRPTAACTIDDLIENSLDVEWSGSIAKNAQIILVTAASQSSTDDTLYDAESFIVNNTTAHVLSVSYGECELFEGTSGNTEYNTLWEDAASEGIAVFVAAGDSGAASCDDDQSASPYVAEFGVSVSGLASTPYNTAVGGTDFNWCPYLTSFNGNACPASPYWSSANTTPAGASNPSISALGYVPEMPWNETCSNPFMLAGLQALAGPNYLDVSGVNNPEEACNLIGDNLGGENGLEEDYPYAVGLLNTVGGGGGASNCTTSDGTTVASCTGGYPKPSWQSPAGLTGVVNDGKRDLPDVSFFSADGYVSDSAYLICVEENGGSPCTYSTDAEPFASEVGGTSASTPPMAGVMALINQKTGAAQGFANPELYKLAAAQTYSSCSAESVTTSSTCLFNDIDANDTGTGPDPFTSPGTNAMPCDYGAQTGISPNCTAVDSLDGSSDTVGILSGYNSGTGYDQATGLGSLNVANVVNAWPATVGSSKATVTVTPAVTTLSSNETLAVTGTVAGAVVTSTGVNVAPTGTVTLTAGTYTSSTILSSSGGYSFTVPASSFSTGTDTLTASYAGDVNYGTAKGAATVAVTTSSLLAATVTVTPASSTLDSNSTLSVPVAVTGSGAAPSGTVTLSGGGYTSSAETLVSGNFTFSIPVNSLSAGSDTLTVTYSGDAIYGSTAGTAVVTVTESTFSLNSPAAVVTPTGGVAPGSAASAAVTVAPVAGYVGSVTVTCSLTTSPSGATDAPTCSGGGPSLGVTLPNTTTQTLTFTVSTTAASTTTVDELKKHHTASNRAGWIGAGSGALLSLLVFFGIPARRRNWRSMLGLIMLMAALGSLAACGSGGGGSSNGGTTTVTDPGTSAGNYVFTVTGVGTPSVSSPVTVQFTVTVN